MALLGPLRRIASGGALRARDLAVPMIDQEALLARAEAAGPGAGVRICCPPHDDKYLSAIGHWNLRNKLWISYLPCPWAFFLTGRSTAAAAAHGNLVTSNPDLVSPEAECSICLDIMDMPVRGRGC